jgi:hypothetical protein
MALPDLTGQNIENTYQRVLQTDGALIWDGTGSLVTLQYTGSFTGDGSGLTGVSALITPAGPDKSIQFNDGGIISGSGALLFDKISNNIILTGSMFITQTLSASILEGTINGGTF